MTSMADILTFAPPLSSDDPKAILKSANKLIWDVMKTVADDKDTLQANSGILLEVEGFANEWKEEAKAHTATRRGWAMRRVYARDELVTGFKTSRLLEGPATNKGTNVTSGSESRPTAFYPVPKLFSWSKMSVKRKRTTFEMLADAKRAILRWSSELNRVQRVKCTFHTNHQAVEAPIDVDSNNKWSCYPPLFVALLAGCLESKIWRRVPPLPSPSIFSRAFQLLSHFAFKPLPPPLHLPCTAFDDSPISVGPDSDSNDAARQQVAVLGDKKKLHAFSPARPLRARRQVQLQLHRITLSFYYESLLPLPAQPPGADKIAGGTRTRTEDTPPEP
ncbi:hypothetical protein L210DRAFT_3650832 [Boletus edulis BED1]|uniref:Uncharacterized protein n=1 Tax=Boletus edulis BED1 TaxID=1328754 RepID=A0AAD4BJA6_BOLED|nr:hypothetical protein L210DRAFT_3650832 [Boletus edulis BED1]